jgi:hypothetical protein
MQNLFIAWAYMYMQAVSMTTCHVNKISAPGRHVRHIECLKYCFYISQQTLCALATVILYQTWV